MKKLIYIFLVLCVASSAFAQSSSQLMREGLLEHKNSNFGEAIRKYKQAIKLGADRNLANYNLGASYYRMGKADSALMCWQSVATTEKDKDLQAMAWHNIGNAFVKQGNFDKAQEAYKQSLKLNPTDENTRYNLAYTQRKLQQQPPQQKPQEEEKEMDKEQSEDVLKALDNEEKKLHKRKIPSNAPQPAKDW